MHYVDISDNRSAVAFLERIGCFGKRGDVIPSLLAELRTKTANPNCDTIPIWEVADKIKEVMKERGVTHRELASRLGEQYCGSYLLGYESKKRSSSIGRVAKIGEALGSDWITGLAHSDVFWDEVKEIVPLGQQETFDATVEGTHNFIANGIVVHNSLEQDSNVVMFIYRDELYNTDSDYVGMPEIIVAKQRSGPTGMARVAFLDAQTRFASLSKEA
jgi:replicative DNA helicase